MRIAIAGAGSVGRSIASELVDNGHQVMLIDRNPDAITPEEIEAAEWVQADACELTSLEDAGLHNSDVVIACTGDDKANLVLALLAKTEFAIDRVVGRVNDPRNEWLFTEAWGVDVAVSTPRILAALVEEAVTVGELVRLFELRQGQANLLEVTLADTSSIAGQPVRDLTLPEDAALVAIVRGERVIVPQPDEPLEAGDELLFVATPAAEDDIRRALA